MNALKNAIISSGIMLITAVLAIVIIQLIKAITSFLAQNGIG